MSNPEEGHVPEQSIGGATLPAATKGPVAPTVPSNVTSTPQTMKVLLWRRINDDDILLRVAIEAGVFDMQEGAKAAEHIKEAHESALRGDEALANEQLTKAEITLHEVIYKKSMWWRMINYHQLHILAYHLAILALLLNVGSGWLTEAADIFWTVPAAAFGLGALGSTLRGLYYLHLQVAKRIYRVGFLVSHLAAPWIGGLFGLFVFLLLEAGVLAMQGGPVPTQAPFSPSPLSYALAFLAGFKWEWLLNRLESIGSKVGSVDNSSAGSDASSVPASSKRTPTAEESAANQG